MGYVPPKLIKVPDGCSKAERFELGRIYLSGLKDFTRNKNLRQRIESSISRMTEEVPRK